MPATKYDAMIAALDMIQNVTDKPDWMLREEELALRERMHEDEMEMSLMQTQIKTGTDNLDDIRKQINTYEAQLVDVKARILGTGKKKLDEIKLPEYKTVEGQSTPDEMYKLVDEKFRDQLVTLERDKRTLSQNLRELKDRYRARDTELGTAIGIQTVKDQEAKDRQEAREKKRLQLQETTASEITKQRIATEARLTAEYNQLDPAAIEDQMNILYAGMQTQMGDEGAFTPKLMMEYAEGLGGDYAANAEQIALKLTELFTFSMTGESFLTALGNEDPMYMDFLTEIGVPTQPMMQQLNLLSLSGVATTQTQKVDAATEIQNMINKLPAIRRK